MDKSKHEIRSFLSRMRLLMRIFPYYVLLFVMDGDKEDRQTVEALNAEAGNLPITQLKVYGLNKVSNWTRLLNGGLVYLRMKGVSDGKIFVSSFEAELNYDSLRTSVSRIRQSFHPVPCISFRKTLMELLPSLSDMIRDAGGSIFDLGWKALEDAIQYVRHEHDALSSFSYALPTLCRNTALVWDFRTLWAAGGFDPRCNEWGGQEELAHIVRLALLRDQGIGPLIEGSVFRYSDPRLSVVKDLEDQQRKIATEMGAVLTILRHYRNGDLTFLPDFNLDLG